MLNRAVELMKRRTLTLLTETALIEKQSAARDIFGSTNQTAWDTVASDVSCRVIDAGQQATSKTVLSGEQENISDEVRLIFPVGTELGADYRVTVGSRVYQVVSIVDDRTDATDAQCIATRLR